MSIDELVEAINNHHGEVFAFPERPANTTDKDGNPVNTALTLHIGRDLVIVLDDTSERGWYVERKTPLKPSDDRPPGEGYTISRRSED